MAPSISEVIPAEQTNLFSRVLPMVSKWLEKKERLQLRLVSKTCEKSVNSILEADNGLNPSGFDGPWGFRWDYPEKVIRFMEDIREYQRLNRNPFVGRAMTVTMTDFSDRFPSERKRPATGSDVEENFWRNILAISNSFGEHVHFLNLHLSLTSLRAYRLIQQLTGCMPNLRGLLVSGDVDTTSPEVESLELFQEEITMYPPFHMPHLETLRIEIPEFPHILVDALVTRYLGKLKYISVDHFSPSANFRREASNLRELCLWDARNSTLPKNLSALANGTAPVLESVKIVVGKWESFDLLESLKILSKFPTIKALAITTEMYVYEVNFGIKKIPVEDREKIQLPNIKILRIHHAPRIDYSFLLCFPALEQLRITGQMPWPKHPNPPEYLAEMGKEEVEIHRYIFTKEDGGLYHSNVWKKMPHLQIVRFEHVELDDYLETVEYTFRQFWSRDGYNKFIEGQG